MRNLQAVARDYHAAVAGGLLERLQVALRGVALRGEAAAKENATTAPRVRGGLLRRSITGSVHLDGDALILSLEAGRGGAEAYAGTQEYGHNWGRPRAPVPLSPHAATPAGVARFPSPRAVEGLFALKIRGRVFLAKRGEDGGLQLWYLLIDRVRPHRYLGQAMDGAQELAREAVGRATRDLMEAAGHAQ